MPKNKKTVYCSAGLNYVLLYPNGDVYRCMADYNAKRPPLFNAQDGWRKPNKPMVCTHESCYAGCDIEWSKKWVFGDKGKEPTVIYPQVKYTKACDESNPWVTQTLDNPLENYIYIIWAPSLICNYNCRYCGCAVGKHDIYNEFSSSSPEISVGKWIKIWTEICDKYDGGYVVTSGGEPLLSNALLPVFEFISLKFRVSLTTNLSIRVMQLARSKVKVARENSTNGIEGITASLHPTAKDFNRDSFFGALLYLKEKGFFVSVHFVAYPLQMYLALEYKEWCDRHGIPFYVSPWRGVDNDGITANYAKEEKRFIDSLGPILKTNDAQSEFFNFGCAIKIEKSKIQVPEGKSVTLKGSVTNSGDMAWNNDALTPDNAFKVGGKLYDYSDTAKLIREFRATLPERAILSQESCDFAMAINMHGVSAGVYRLEIDMVKELSFWFQDKGYNIPLDVQVNVSPHTAELPRFRAKEKAAVKSQGRK